MKKNCGKKKRAAPRGIHAVDQGSKEKMFFENRASGYIYIYLSPLPIIQHSTHARGLLETSQRYEKAFFFFFFFFFWCVVYKKGREIE